MFKKLLYDHAPKLQSAAQGTPGATKNRYYMIISPKLTSAALGTPGVI